MHRHFFHSGFILSYYLPAPAGSDQTTLNSPSLNCWGHSFAFVFTRDSQRTGNFVENLVLKIMQSM